MWIYLDASVGGGESLLLQAEKGPESTCDIDGRRSWPCLQISSDVRSMPRYPGPRAYCTGISIPYEALIGVEGLGGQARHLGPDRGVR